MPGSDRPTTTPNPGPMHPAAPDPTRTLRTLKGLALGVTVVATAGVTGLVLLHPAGAAEAATTEETVIEEAAGPVVTAEDPFFNRRTASAGGSQVRRSRRVILRSRGS